MSTLLRTLVLQQRILPRGFQPHQQILPVPASLQDSDFRLRDVGELGCWLVEGNETLDIKVLDFKAEVFVEIVDGGRLGANSFACSEESGLCKIVSGNVYFLARLGRQSVLVDDVAELWAQVEKPAAGAVHWNAGAELGWRLLMALRNC